MTRVIAIGLLVVIAGALAIVLVLMTQWRAEDQARAARWDKEDQAQTAEAARSVTRVHRPLVSSLSLKLRYLICLFDCHPYQRSRRLLRLGSTGSVPA